MSSLKILWPGQGQKKVSAMKNPFENGSGSAEVVPVDIRRITGAEFLALGMSQIAYMKSVTHDGEQLVAIHAADGTPMAVADDEESALDAILEHEMIPTLLQ